ncbi:MAG TPA: adenylyltransferase/cytidyltransferase family protein [Pirellulales bacterium]|nr:adenylyltransferase/cytidyltransferase family protein [Pirellulales bacterium]
MQPADLSRVRTIPLETRANKVALERFARPPRAGASFADFAASLPAILAGEEFRQVVQAITAACRRRRPVILAMGAHVIKCGLNPVVIDLMRRGVVTGLVLNGSGAIHDFEIALAGETSEDVAAGLRDGTFGMVRETGQLMNEGINCVKQSPESGLGMLLGQQLEAIGAPNQDQSLLAMGRKLGVPVTVHVAIGADIIHMHPSADGAAIGQATFNDFRILCAELGELSGGAYLNVGSAVVLPEVFLKAFTVAQNLGADLHDFTTVNMDMIAHYRPGENVVRRLAPIGGGSYTLLGRHEFMVPLLAQSIVESLADDAVDSAAAPSGSGGKLVGLDELLRLRNDWRRQGRRVVWTNGCFDLFHVGHLRNLQAARQHGDVLVVGVNSDASVRQLKGPERPVIPAVERAEIIASLGCVDCVTVFDEATPEPLLRRLQPDVHCKGAEYAPPYGKPIPERETVQAYGGRIEFIPLVPGISTTDVLERIRLEAKD